MGFGPKKAKIMRKIIALLVLLISLLPLTARDIYSLNDGWQFFFKHENESENARIVTLPHSWNTDPQAGAQFNETTANYLRDVFLPDEWSSKRLFVKFYGAQSVANFFVNGRHVGEHRGGGTAFTFEITDFVRFGSDNLLQVVVSNTFRSDVLPVSTDVNLYGGLYRDVELIVTDDIAISPLYYGSDGVLVRPSLVTPERIEGEVEVRLLMHHNSIATLTLEIYNELEKVVYSREQRVMGNPERVGIPFLFNKPKLWSPDSPNRYRVMVRLSNESTRDEIHLYTGFRSISIDEKSGWLAINDTPTRLRGVVLHHDNALGTLTTEADLQADLHTVQDIGATAIRSAVMPHSQRFYDLCDQLGLLVWIDSPLQRAPFMGDMAYFSTPAFEQNGLEQLTEIVVQNFNHPSVTMWGLFSRLIPRDDQMLKYLKMLNNKLHELDPLRPTVALSDQDGPINFITDLIVWRQDVGWQRGQTEDVLVWRDQLQRKWSHLHSAISYGGEGLLGMNVRQTHQTQRTNWLSESRQTRFHEEYNAHLATDSLFWGVWVESLFEYGSARRPYSLSGDGLITLDRREKKDAFYLYRALWNKKQKTVHLVDRRFRMRDDSEQFFKIYSSEPDPLLLVNDDSVQLHEVAPCQYHSDTLRLRGNTQVRVSAGGIGDGVTIQVGNALRLQPRQGLQQTTNR